MPGRRFGLAPGCQDVQALVEGHLFRVPDLGGLRGQIGQAFGQREGIVAEAERAHQALAGNDRSLPRACELSCRVGVERLLAHLVEPAHVAGLHHASRQVVGSVGRFLDLLCVGGELLRRDRLEERLPRLGRRPNGIGRRAELRLFKVLACHLRACGKRQQAEDVEHHRAVDLQRTASGQPPK